ncbi:MAG TPA: PilZ domain-containing protein, partial [Acidimicrobiia bacterium]|nr:PilZ domain-containing protein [Acidimicrobiia bacterium]
VGLVCRSGFPRGARVVVAIALSDSHVVALGTVVGTSTDGKDHVVHVMFDAMREADRELLHRFVLDATAGASVPPQG